MVRAFRDTKKGVKVAKRLRQRQMPAERLLWKKLRGRRFQQTKFRRQASIGKYIVDFVCTSKNLVVELDGDAHLLKITKDKTREEYLRQLGFEILRLKNEQVLQSTDFVLEKISSYLVPPHPDPLPEGEGGKAS